MTQSRRNFFELVLTMVAGVMVPVLRSAPGPTQFKGHHPLQLLRPGDIIRIDAALLSRILAQELAEVTVRAEMVNVTTRNSTFRQIVPCGFCLEMRQNFQGYIYVIQSKQRKLRSNEFCVTKVTSAESI